jgi:four helix bundle protein
MNQYKTFEELLVWQKAHEVIMDVYRLTKKGEFSKDWALMDQTRRAATSVTANIVEGHERRSKREFAYFLNVSKASSSELRSHLIIARDLNYISPDEFNSAKEKLVEVNRMIAGLIKYLEGKKNTAD